MTCNCPENKEYGAQLHSGINIFDLELCVCLKKELYEPSKMTYICNTCNKRGYIEGLQYVSSILSSVKSSGSTFYTAKCCGGCKFTKKEIEQKYECALASGIEYCIYQKDLDGTGYEYLSDSLNEVFIKYLESSKYAVKITDIVAD